jgi:ABC-type Mn2+/Zn2+ transport system ATPase subunit
LSATAPPLEVVHLRAGYVRDAWIVEDASFALAAGSMTALVGPNGAGKSTLLKAILGLAPIVRAERVAFFGGDLDAARARVAFIPQRSAIDWDFPATARDVVAMGLVARIGLFRRTGRGALAAAERALDSVGLLGMAHEQVGELSGGQQQRVLVARALVAEPELLLLDEPFANVDAASEAHLTAVLRAIAARGSTVLAVHHDLRSVRAHFDEAILLNRALLAHGPVAAVLTDARLAEAYGLAASRRGAEAPA